MTVNERIKEIRLALKQSQREFAQSVYISNGYLSEIETGHKEVKPRLVQLIANAFSVNTHWLLSGEGRMFNSTPEEKMQRMIGLFNELYPEYQDFVLRQIDELIELQNTRCGSADAGKDSNGTTD
jgi:transcriptional regulator with XRE-family HTH domain